MLLCLLPGCSGKNEPLEQALAFRGRLLKAQSCSFDMDVTADYGDRLYSFSTGCQGDGQGNLSFTVTAPETISGITGTITESEGKLTFADTALYFDLMAEGRLSPISAPWVFLKTLRGGCITAACREGNLLRLTIDDSYQEDAMTLDIWLEGESPVRAEVLWEGKRILSMDVESFQIS